jgi:hypothetical protein
MSAIRHLCPAPQNYVIHQRKAQDEELTIQFAWKVVRKGIRTLPTIQDASGRSAVTQIMESSDTHQTALASAPLSGFGRAFLERLGSSLVTAGGVQLAEASAQRN